MARLLYIEDNDQNFYLVHFILTHRGHDVIRAENGSAGLETALREPFDLILLDIQLPVMDGHAVARALRGHSKLAATPIVALTSYAMLGDREKAIESGCTDYIEKPINPATFVAQIERHLRLESDAGDSR